MSVRMNMGMIEWWGGSGASAAGLRPGSRCALGGRTGRSPGHAPGGGLSSPSSPMGVLLDGRGSWTHCCCWPGLGGEDTGGTAES